MEDYMCENHFIISNDTLLFVKEEEEEEEEEVSIQGAKKEKNKQCLRERKKPVG